MLTQDLRFKNNPAIQSLYAWFPDAFQDESKYKFQTPKDIYVNLGSRPPLPKSNTDGETLKQYTQELVKNKIANIPEKTFDINVRPPWALCHPPTPNRPLTKEERKKRVKSAHPRYPVPADRIVLQIPTPELKSLFNDETSAELDTTSINSNIKQIRPKTSVINRSTTNLSNYSDENSTNENIIEQNVIDKVQVTNVGKIPLIDNATLIQEALGDQSKSNRRKKLTRPKTSVDQVNKANMIKQSSESQPLETNENFNLLKRSKSCLTRKTNSPLNSKSTQVMNNTIDLNNSFNPAGNTLKYSSTHNLNSSNIETPSTTYVNGVMIKKGNWKDDLLNRGLNAQIRPPYFTKIDLDKIKAYPMIQDIHYKASETYFYNTIPVKKTTFVINPNFISENLQTRKFERYGPNNEIKFSRDYAFVY